MQHLTESDVRPRQGSGGPGHAISHVIAPWTVASESLFIAVTVIQPGAATAMTTLPGVESAHLTLEGEGTEIVEGEEVQTAAGSFVFLPRGAAHQVVNRGSTPLRVLSISTPPPPAPADVTPS